MANYLCSENICGKGVYAQDAYSDNTRHAAGMLPIYMALVNRENDKHQTDRYRSAPEIFAGVEGLSGEQMIKRGAPEC